MARIGHPGWYGAIAVRRPAARAVLDMNSKRQIRGLASQENVLPGTPPASTLPTLRVGNLIRETFRMHRSGGQNIAALDGLRGLAVLAVVCLHTLELSRSSVVLDSQGCWTVLGSGVELFFVLSGFLLFLPYARCAFNGRSLPSLRTYFRRRAVRILPAYWASLVVFMLWLSPVAKNRAGFVDATLHVALIHNYLVSTFESINGPYWTMAVEAQFYVLFPVIAWMIVRAIQAGRVRLVGAILLTIVAVSIAAQGAGYVLSAGTTGLSLHVTALAVFQYLPVFCAGIVACLFFVAASEGPLATRDSRRFSRAMGVIGLCTLATCVPLNQVFSSQNGSGYVVAQVTGLAYGVVLMGCLLGWSSWNRWLANPVLRFFGMVSYSLYIWNRVVLHRLVGPLARLVAADVSWVFLPVVAVIGTLTLVPISLASYLVFERPFLTLRKRSDPAPLPGRDERART